MRAARKRPAPLDPARVELEARLVIAEAERARLLDALRAVLKTLPQEWAPAEAQAVRREARAVVEECQPPRGKQ